MRSTSTLRWLVAGMAVLYLGLVAGFGIGFADEIPALAWVGLGVVTAIVAVLAVATVVLFERTERGAGTGGTLAPRAADGLHRLLVVADAGCEHDDACPAVLGHLHEGIDEVLVVAPAIASPFRHVMDDEAREQALAGKRVGALVEALTLAGVRATGVVGSDLPLEAIQDALAWFPADEILIAAPPEELGAWSERGLVDRARATFGRPVVHVHVLRTTAEPSRAPMRG